MDGGLAEENPLRFSSEYFDDETGLVYYNYRYYSPRMGRWINRDPIEEEDSVNLYVILQNDPMNLCDILGNKREYRPPRYYPRQPPMPIRPKPATPPGFPKRGPDSNADSLINYMGVNFISIAWEKALNAAKQPCERKAKKPATCKCCCNITITYIYNEAYDVAFIIGSLGYVTKGKCPTEEERASGGHLRPLPHVIKGAETLYIYHNMLCNQNML